MIDFEKLKKSNKTFKVKLFLSYILFTLLIIVSITIIHLFFSQEQKELKFKREASLQSYEKNREFINYFKKREHALLALSKNRYFLENILLGKNKHYVNLLFFTLMEANQDYMQLRFINKNGKEQIRFDRDRTSLRVYKSNILQNKIDRYYFLESKKLKKGEVWLSSIDLNIEYGKIEKPFKPVLRVSTPIYIKDKFQGILIINLFMADLLRSLTTSSIYDIYITDNYGYYLKHKNKDFNWSYYTNRHNILHDFDSKTVKSIQLANEPLSLSDKKIFIQPLYIKNNKLSLILIEKDKSIKKAIESNNKMILTILLFSIIIAFIFSVVLAKPLNKMYEILVRQKKELFDLANNLEKKVQIETLKNAKKDRILQHQNKLAELGDMIGSIAHQWRHPLTRLSLILQNLKAYNKKGKLSDKILNDSLENSIYQIEFMSTTIDNFKNFYKNEKQNKEFYIIDALNSVVKIVGSILEHQNIKILINNSSNMMIYGNQNELAQVLMNLIMNSKDAFLLKNIKDAFIKIDIYDSKKNIIIEVSDNAGGIESKNIEKIFDAYFTTKENEGTGIGLYLAKTIIEDKFQGKIKVKSINNGSLFKIKL